MADVSEVSRSSGSASPSGMNGRGNGTSSSSIPKGDSSRRASYLERTQGGEVKLDRAVKQMEDLTKAKESEVDILSKKPLFLTAEGEDLTLRVLQNVCLKMEGVETHEVRVSKNSLSKVLKQRQSERQGCLSLPFTISFFLFYTLSVSYHEGVRSVYMTESQMRDYLETYTFDDAQSKDLGGITEVKDIWRWIHQALVPAIFQQRDHLGRPLPQKMWSTVLRKSRARGGLLMEQFRDAGTGAPGTMSGLNLEFNASANDLARLRFPGEGFRALPEIDSDFGRRLRAAKDGGGASAVNAAGPPSGEAGEPENTYPFFLFEQEEEAVIHERLRYLEERNWLDDGSKQLAVKMIFWNEALQLIQRVTIRLVLPDEGGINSAVTLASSWINTYEDWYGVVSDVIWMALLVYIMVLEFKEVIHHCQEEKLLSYFMDFWNCLDWATIVIGWGLVFLFVRERAGVANLVSMMNDVSLQPPDERYWKSMYRIHAVSDEVAQANMVYRLGEAYYMLLIMLRFFKAFKAQPRLALVTNTMYCAGSDLIHFGIVFISVFLTFAFSASVLFGRRLADYSSFVKAFSTCFALACGDFNWSQLSAEHPISTTIWFWGFMVLVFLVMLNMVLAIVMDVYTEVRANAITGDPVWTQAWGILQYRIPEIYHKIRKIQGKQEYTKRRNLQFLNYVSDEEILEHLHHLEVEVTKSGLRSALPSMSEAQAESVLQAAEEFEQQSVQKGMSLSDAMKMLHAMSQKVDKMEKHMEHKRKPQVSKNPVMKKIVRKCKRILLQALHTGDLQRVANDMANSPTTQQTIQDREFQLKIQRAEQLLNTQPTIESLNSSDCGESRYSTKSPGIQPSPLSDFAESRSPRNAYTTPRGIPQSDGWNTERSAVFGTELAQAQLAFGALLAQQQRQLIHQQQWLQHQFQMFQQWQQAQWQAHMQQQVPQGHAPRQADNAFHMHPKPAQQEPDQQQRWEQQRNPGESPNPVLRLQGRDSTKQPSGDPDIASL